MNTENTTSKSEKIILFLLDEFKKNNKKLRYEDIVVGVFKKYPTDFHLKGYTEHPDSGDLIHKPLYDFRKKGYIEGANKVFALTQRGVEYATNIIENRNIFDNKVDLNRLSRSSSTEMNRVKSLDGLQLFIKGNKEKIIENDFYNYFNITVKTPSYRFEGRFNAMAALIDEISKPNNIPLFKNNPLNQKIIDYHNFLISEYNDLINHFRSNKK